MHFKIVDVWNANKYIFVRTNKLILAFLSVDNEQTTSIFVTDLLLWNQFKSQDSKTRKLTLSI